MVLLPNCFVCVIGSNTTRKYNQIVPNLIFVVQLESVHTLTSSKYNSSHLKLNDEQHGKNSAKRNFTPSYTRDQHQYLPARLSDNQEIRNAADHITGRVELVKRVRETRDGKARQIAGGSGQRPREMRLHIVHGLSSDTGPVPYSIRARSNQISIVRIFSLRRLEFARALTNGDEKRAGGYNMEQYNNVPALPGET
ncbi:hypothetical protein CBL_13779 [Carabus blaptoides fortunei]